jgi:hypothetical protein
VYTYVLWNKVNLPPHVIIDLGEGLGLLRLNTNTTLFPSRNSFPYSNA